MRPRATALLTTAALASLALTGCAQKLSGIDVEYPAASAHQAMLASVAPRRIRLATVADRRTDSTRFGVNPTNGENLVTTRPVPEIVRDALATELARNGHVLVDDKPDVVLTAGVDEAWLDVVDGYSKIQYVGRVAIALAVFDGQSDRALATRQYVGIKRLEADKKAEPPWREVMSAALVRVMHDVATDPELVSAFGRASTATRAGLLPDERAITR